MKKIFKEYTKIKNFITVCSTIVLIPVDFIVIAITIYN